MVDDRSRFVTPASLWPPRFVSERSAWNGHIPFAGWVIDAARPRVFVELGTYTGVSYFAFCDAVARLEIDTRCVAVDTWLGDEHAGRYGEDVFEAVAAHNAEHYGSFSRLMRTTFDEAAARFEAGSIDLLHIDGFHTYEAVRHDFETWLPNLSDRAVVLLHDTNEDRPGFGVRRLFGELAERYPTFELPHDHGLGMVCVGTEPPPTIRSLANADVETRRWVADVYGTLGRGVRSELRHQVLRRRSKRLDRAVRRHRRRLSAIQQSTSWRVTAPLRWIAGRIRRTR